MSLSENLKAMRETRHKTIEDMALCVGVTVPTYTKYELGTSVPKLENILKIADELEVSLDYLFERDNYIPTAKDFYRNSDEDVAEVITEIQDNENDDVCDECVIHYSDEELENVEVTSEYINNNQDVNETIDSINTFNNDIEDNMDDICIAMLTKENAQLLATICLTIPKTLSYKTTNFKAKDPLTLKDIESYKGSIIVGIWNGTRYLHFLVDGEFADEFIFIEKYDGLLEVDILNEAEELRDTFPVFFTGNYKIKKRLFAK